MCLSVRSTVNHLHRMIGNKVCYFTRFSILLSCVAWLQLFPVSSPYWTVRYDLDVEAAGAQGLLDDCWYPSGMVVSARSMVQRIHRISDLVVSGDLGDACRSLGRLGLGSLLGLLTLSDVCWRGQQGVDPCPYLSGVQKFTRRESTGCRRSPVLHQELLKCSLWGQRRLPQGLLESLHQTFSCSVGSRMIWCTSQVDDSSFLAPALEFFRGEGGRIVGDNGVWKSEVCEVFLQQINRCS